MDSKNGFEPLAQENTGMPQLAPGGRPKWTDRATHIRRILVAGSLVLVVLLGFSTLHQRVSCHGSPNQVEQDTTSLAVGLGNAAREVFHAFLERSSPVPHTVGAAPHVDFTATLLRLARRQ